MGKQPRKSQPITGHPLFPAIVALWFGALFGLGSLAVRPSLLESLVISTGIDAIVPQAAPPLGITARILVAASLAVIGGLLGGWIARRIARPKPEARERRRHARPVESSKKSSFGAAAKPAATGHADDKDEVPETAVLASRRRPLAVPEENPRDAAYHDAAPLPGSPPQILDVTEFDFTQPDAGEQPMAEQETELDLGVFVAQQVEDSAINPVLDRQFAPPAPAHAQVDAHSDRPFAEPERPELSGIRDSIEAEPVSGSGIGPDFDSAPTGAGQAFAAPLAVPAVPPALAVSETQPAARPFAAPAQAEADARTFAAPMETVAQARPFAAPAEPLPAAQPFAAPPQGMPAAQSFAPPAMPASEGQPIAAPQPAAAALANPQDAAFATTSDVCDAAIAPATLQVEARPFDAAAFEAGPTPESLPAGTSVPQPVALDDPQPSPALQRFAHLTVQLPAEDEPARLSSTQAPEATTSFEAPPLFAGASGSALAAQPEPQPAAQPTATASRIETSELAELSQVELIERLALSLQKRREQAVAPASAASDGVSSVALAAGLAAAAPEPVAFQPTQAPEPIAPASVEAAAPQPSVSEADAAPALALPAALRPIDFGEIEEADEPAAFVPPRTIQMPAVPVEQAAEPFPASHAPFAPSLSAETGAVAAEPELEEEASVPEESYSSLLDIGRPAEQRQQFVRIEEPEPEEDRVEPVVIFPGQTARAGSRFGAPADIPAAPDAEAAPSGPPSEGPVPFRRFDAASAQPGAAQEVKAVDPAETERALRSALATLQRMSGAA